MHRDRSARTLGCTRARCRVVTHFASPMATGARGGPGIRMTLAALRHWFRILHVPQDSSGAREVTADPPFVDLLPAAPVRLDVLVPSRVAARGGVFPRRQGRRCARQHRCAAGRSRNYFTGDWRRMFVTPDRARRTRSRRQAYDRCINRQDATRCAAASCRASSGKRRGQPKQSGGHAPRKRRFRANLLGRPARAHVPRPRVRRDRRSLSRYARDAGAARLRGARGSTTPVPGSG